VKFAVTEPGMTIEGASGATEIATGSGAAFPVRFANAGDRKATADGFTVLVNGELKSGGRLIQSFRSEATVPRNMGPIPCSQVFTANRVYELGVFDTKHGAMNWGLAQVSTLGPGPADPPGAQAYAASLFMNGQSAPARVSVTGSNVVMLDGKGTVFISGECTGQGVRGRFANSRFTQTPEVLIRAR
jgi:hypothetical protein